MMVMDVPPDVPAHYAPVLVTEVSQAKKPATSERTIGVCQVFGGGPEYHLTAANVLSPALSVFSYFQASEKVTVGMEGTTTLLQGPAHGTMEDLGTKIKRHGEIIDSGIRNYAYRGDGSYSGPDQATFLVEIGSYKVKVIYQFRVLPRVGGGDYTSDKEYCPNGYVWKISLNPNAPIYTFLALVGAYEPLCRSLECESHLRHARRWGARPTTGDTITLDPSAAGHGLFVCRSQERPAIEGDEREEICPPAIRTRL